MATLLPDGQVLVTGANSGGGAPLPSPELYNPAASTWAVTGQMNTPRIDATATLLPDGLVLVAGGSGGGSNALDSAELYHPATGAWSVTGSMHQARSASWRRSIGDPAPRRPAAHRRPGGCELNLLSSAKLYNPANGTFSPTGSMTTPRVGQSGTCRRWPGAVASGTGRPRAELFNPATGSHRHRQHGNPRDQYPHFAARRRHTGDREGPGSRAYHPASGPRPAPHGAGRLHIADRVPDRQHRHGCPPATSWSPTGSPAWSGTTNHPDRHALQPGTGPGPAPAV